MGHFTPGRDYFTQQVAYCNINTKYQAGRVFLSYFLWSGEMKARGFLVPGKILHPFPDMASY